MYGETEIQKTLAQGHTNLEMQQAYTQDLLTLGSFHGIAFSSYQMSHQVHLELIHLREGRTLWGPYEQR